MNHSETPQLHKVAALAKFALGCELYTIRGFIDTPQKITACYLAMKLTKAKDRDLGIFFKINPQFMRNEVEAFAVNLLLLPEAKKSLENIEDLFWEMELANVRT